MNDQLEIELKELLHAKITRDMLTEMLNNPAARTRKNKCELAAMREAYRDPRPYTNPVLPKHWAYWVWESKWDQGGGAI